MEKGTTLNGIGFRYLSQNIKNVEGNDYQNV